MGGIQLPKCKLYCALEDAPGQLTWACICPEGQEVLSYGALWRLFTCSKTAEMPLDTDVYTTESHPRWGIALCAKVERKFPDFFFFPQKTGGLVLLCGMYLYCRQNSQRKLGCSAHGTYTPSQGGKRHFPNSFIAAAAYTSDSRALFCLITAYEAFHLQWNNVLFGRCFPL